MTLKLTSGRLAVLCIIYLQVFRVSTKLHRNYYLKRLEIANGTTTYLSQIISEKMMDLTIFTVQKSQREHHIL